MVKLNNRVDNSFTLFSKIGSFWSSNLTEEAKRQSRKMCYTPAADDRVETLFAHKDWLGFNQQTVYNFTWYIHPNDVTVIGPDLEQRITARVGTEDRNYRLVLKPSNWKLGTEGYIPLYNVDDSELFTIGDDLLLIPDSTAGDIVITDDSVWTTRYVVKTRDFTPLALQTTDGDLLFPPQAYEVRQGFVIFNQHPLEITDKAFTVVKGTRYTPHPLAYTVGADHRCKDVSWVVEYLRNNQSPAIFEKALNQLVGAHVIPVDSTLLKKHTTPDGVYYYFDTHNVFVDYLHEELEELQFYQKGFIVGDLVKIFCEALQGDGWFRNVTLPLPLDNLVPVKGLQITRDRLPLELLKVDTGLNYLALPVTQVSDTYKSENQVLKYHSWIKQHSSNALPTVPNLLTPEYESTVDFLLNHVLKNRVLFIKLNTHRLGESLHTQVLSFLHENKPLGVIVITENAYESTPPSIPPPPSTIVTITVTATGGIAFISTVETASIQVITIIYAEAFDSTY
jgi:hypothetical protein